MHLIDGHVQPIGAGIFEQQKIAANAVDRQVFETDILADAVVRVDQIIAGGELGLADRHAFFWSARPMPARGMSEELGVAQYRQAELRQLEALVDGAVTDEARAARVS